jgi:hypothetical protein
LTGQDWLLKLRNVSVESVMQEDSTQWVWG